MVFSSLIFLCIFLPVNFILYFISTNKTYRNIILLVTSLFFYAWGEPVWVILLVFTATFDYFNGLIVEKFRGNWKSKFSLILSITVNLFVLGFFKYSAFLTINLNNLLHIHLPYNTYRLPIGISFYTFQSMSYVLDVYRGEAKAQKRLYKFLLFVSLFHQLVAGPIVRYVDIANEIENRTITMSKFSDGINRFVIGLGKKVIFANTAGELVNIYLNGDLSKISVFGAWFGIIMYAVQIYFDFSGYSDMAIGLGKMFGFTYKENFDYPYISKSATEFWRRWHISLGSFFRDYVYIPLGGNRKHLIRNIIIVWALTGLWHGADWNFLLWGLYYGGLILIEKLFLSKLLKKLPAFISNIYLIIAMLVGWVFFYFTDLKNAFSLLGTMFGFSGHEFVDGMLQINIINNLVFLILALLCCTPIFKKIIDFIKRYFQDRRIIYFFLKQILNPVVNFCILIAAIILLVGKTYNPFLYFRF